MSSGAVGTTYVLDALSETMRAGARPPALTLVDLRARIVAVVAFAVTTVVLDDFLALGCALAFSLAALIHMRLPLGKTIKRVIVVETFVLAMLIFVPFAMRGETAFTLFNLHASWEGLYRVAEIGLKANAIVLMMMATIGTSTPVEVGHAMARLRVPLVLVHLLLFTIRYIEVLMAEYRRLRVAMRTRGFRMGNNRHTLRTVGYLLGMLLVRAVDRSERILMAMKCRGFNGALPIMDDMAFVARRDGPFAVLVVVVVAALITLEVLRVATV